MTKTLFPLLTNAEYRDRKGERYEALYVLTMVEVELTTLYVVKDQKRQCVIATMLCCRYQLRRTRNRTVDIVISTTMGWGVTCSNHLIFQNTKRSSTPQPRKGRKWFHLKCKTRNQKSVSQHKFLVDHDEDSWTCFNLTPQLLNIEMS